MSMSVWLEKTLIKCTPSEQDLRDALMSSRLELLQHGLQ
jgi:hypothetical protein